MPIWYDKEHDRRLNRFWWKEPKDVMHDAVFGLVKTLKSEQPHHEVTNTHFVRLYGNLEILGLDADSYARVDNYEEHVTFNVVESSIDTIHADITSQKHRMMFLTDGGRWEQRERAKGLTQFVAGQFYHSEIHDVVAPDCALDAAVLGTGVAKIHIKDHQPTAERVFPNEILVDDAEAIDRKPRQMFHLKRVPRQSLITTYGKPGGRDALSKKIHETQEAREEGSPTRSIADMVDVIEAWHLPNRPTKKGDTDDTVLAAGGVHFVGVENTPIVVEPWRASHFPFAILRYKRRQLGFWGKGVAEILEGAQVGINELLWKIHLSLKLSGPKIFVHPGSELSEAHLDNEIWSIIETVTPPTYVTFESVPPDLFRQVREEIQNAFNLVGVSMIAARSELPAGIEGGSGKALRIYSDIKSKRFIKFAQEYAYFYKQLAEQFVEVTREVAQQGYEILSPSDDGTAKLVKWSEVDLPRDKYIMQVYPTNYLSTTPSHRLRDMEAFLNVFPEMRQHAMALFDFPDLKAVTGLVTAGIEIIKKMLEHNLSGKGDIMLPQPFMDLELAIKLAQSYYMEGLRDGAPEAGLANLRSFMTRAAKMMQPEPVAAPPAAGVPPLPGSLGPSSGGPLALVPPTVPAVTGGPVPGVV